MIGKIGSIRRVANGAFIFGAAVVDEVPAFKFAHSLILDGLETYWT